MREYVLYFLLLIIIIISCIGLLPKTGKCDNYLGGRAYLDKVRKRKIRNTTNVELNY